MNKATTQRFWSKVKKTETCWLWQASKRNKGYGAFVWCKNGEVVQGRAHRFSWEIHNGAIPNGMCVLHKCDVPACVNPEHLFLGTKADNNNDMVMKGRHVPGGTYVKGNYLRGTDHHAAKMTPALVRDMRKDRNIGMSYSMLSKKYNIGISATWRICKRKAWAHID